ncbi:MAG: hypothetical protein K0R55_4153 [Sporomusa sp.]|jgi:hypothetical protein|nr:hypothetical protein [Sporomusa sp.]
MIGFRKGLTRIEKKDVDKIYRLLLKLNKLNKRDDGYGRDCVLQRRRSKHFVKLSGKRTVTGLYSGEHIRLDVDVTDGEPLLGQISQVQWTEAKWIIPLSPLFFILSIFAISVGGGIVRQVDICLKKRRGCR